jgi:hypothetical protein
LPADVKINDFAIEVLQYLAYETVAEIVDLCFLVRQDTHKDASDPVVSLMRDVRHPLSRRSSSASSITSQQDNSGISGATASMMTGMDENHHPAILKRKRQVRNNFDKELFDDKVLLSILGLH